MKVMVELDRDVYEIAQAHAAATCMPLGKAVADLLRKVTKGFGGADQPNQFSEKSGGGLGSHLDPVIGHLVSCSGRMLSSEEIWEAIADDDSRDLEAAGVRGINR